MPKSSAKDFNVLNLARWTLVLGPMGPWAYLGALLLTRQGR